MEFQVQDLLILFNSVLSLVLIYSGFCRIVHTTDATKPHIRAAIIALTLAAGVNLVSPGVWHIVPNLVQLVLLTGITAVQVATKIVWKDGPPKSFLRAKKES